MNPTGQAQLQTGGGLFSNAQNPQGQGLFGGPQAQPQVQGQQQWLQNPQQGQQGGGGGIFAGGGQTQGAGLFSQQPQPGPGLFSGQPQQGGNPQPIAQIFQQPQQQPQGQMQPSTQFGMQQPAIGQGQLQSQASSQGGLFGSIQNNPQPFGAQQPQAQSIAPFGQNTQAQVSAQPQTNQLFSQQPQQQQQMGNQLFGNLNAQQQQQQSQPQLSQQTGSSSIFSNQPSAPTAAQAQSQPSLFPTANQPAANTAPNTNNLFGSIGNQPANAAPTGNLFQNQTSQPAQPTQQLAPPTLSRTVQPNTAATPTTSNQPQNTQGQVLGATPTQGLQTPSVANIGGQSNSNNTQTSSSQPAQTSQQSAATFGGLSSNLTAPIIGTPTSTNPASSNTPLTTPQTANSTQQPAARTQPLTTPLTTQAAGGSSTLLTGAAQSTAPAQTPAGQASAGLNLGGQTAAPNLLGATQQRAQPQAQQQKATQQFTALKYHNNQEINNYILSENGSKLIKFLKEDVVQERLVKNCSFYITKGPAQQGQKAGTFEEEMRQDAFKGAMPYVQYDALLKCVDKDLVNRLKKDWKPEAKNVSAKEPLVLRLNEQQTIILQSITILLEKESVIDEELIGIMIPQSDLVSAILNLLTKTYKDQNNQDKSLLQNLVNHFSKVEEQLTHHIELLGGQNIQQYTYWQLFNHLINQQIIIMQIFILLSQYYSEYNIPRFGEYCRELVIAMKNQSFIGIIHSPQLYPNIQNQSYYEHLVQLGMNLERLSNIFLMSITKLPGQSEFKLEVLTQGDQCVPKILDSFQEKNPRLQDKPGYMLAYFDDATIKQLSEVNSIWSRLAECLMTILLHHRDLQLSSKDIDVFGTKCENVRRICFEKLMDKNYESTLLKLLELSKGDEDSQALAYAIKRIVQQQLFNMYLVKTKVQEDFNWDQNAMVIACEILTKLCSRNNIFVDQFWSNYEQRESLISGDVLIFEQVKVHSFGLPLITKLLGVVEWQCQYKYKSMFNPIEKVIRNLSNDRDEFNQTFWNHQILQIMLKFSNGVQAQKSFQELGRRSNASMDYYQQDHSFQRNRERQINSQHSYEQMQELLLVLKFIRTITELNPDQLSQVEASMGFQNQETYYWPLVLIFLRTLTTCNQVCSQELMQTTQAASLKVHILFKIQRQLLSIINSLLECEKTCNVTAHTVSLFGSLAHQQSSQISTKSYWHPISETYDILRKYEQSQQLGINPDCEESAFKLHAEVLQLVKISLTWVNFFDYFPIEAQRDISQINDQVLSIRNHIQAFIASLQIQRDMDIENFSFQNFPNQYEKLIQQITQRKQGYPTLFMKNLLDNAIKTVMTNFQRYINACTTSSLKIVTFGLHIIQLILQRFITNPLSHESLTVKDIQYQNSQELYNRTIQDSLDQLDPSHFIQELSKPLDMQIDQYFFEESGQTVIGVQSVTNIQLTNTLFATVSEIQSNLKNLKSRVVQLLIDTTKTFQLIIQLAIQKSIDIKIVIEMDNILANENYYFYGKNDEEGRTYRLNIVHAVLACLKIQQEGQEYVTKAIIEFDPESRLYKQVYDNLQISDDSKYHNQLLYRGISRSTAISHDMFSTCMQFMSTMVQVVNNYGQKEMGLENMIIQLKIERNGQLQPQIYKHIMIQFVTTIIKRLMTDPGAQQVIDSLEFLLMIVESQQSIANLLLKPSLYNLDQAGLNMLFNVLRVLPSNKDKFKSIEKQQIDLISVALLNSLLEKENQYSKFAHFCRQDQQQTFMNLLRSVLELLREPLHELSNLSALGEITSTNKLEAILSHCFFPANQIEVVNKELIFQQLVLEYCVVGSTNQLCTLEYFLKLLLNQFLTEDSTDVQATLLKEFWPRFGEWVNVLTDLQNSQVSHTKSLETINQYINENRQNRIEVQLNSRQPTDRQEQLSKILQYSLFGFGRDCYIDSHVVVELMKKQEVPTDYALVAAWMVQRFNLLEGLLRQSQKTFKQLHQFITIIVASGTDGQPISCLPTNSLPFVNSLRPDYMRKVLEIFSKQDKTSAKSSEDEKKKEELQKQTTYLAQQLIIANGTKVLVPKGFVSVFTGENSKTERTLEKTFNNLFATLQSVSRNLYESQDFGTPLKYITYPLRIKLEIYAALQLLVDFDPLYQSKGNFPVSSGELQVALCKIQELDNLIRYELSLWHTITQQSDPEVDIYVLQGFTQFLNFAAKALARLSPTDVTLIQTKIQTDLNQGIKQLISQVSQIVLRRNDDSSVYLLTYWLSAAVKVFPEIIKDYILNKKDQKYVDFLKILFQRIRGRNVSNYLYQGVILFLTNLTQDLDLSNFLVLKMLVLDLFKNHPDLLHIKDEQIYQFQNDTKTHNERHIMWCHTLVFVRQCCFGDSDTLRHVWDFITVFRKRIYSTLLELDQSKQYQQLVNLPTVSGIQPGEISSNQLGLAYLTELQHTVAIFTALIHQHHFKLQQPIDHDKLTYTICNLLLGPLTSKRKSKQIFESIKPITMWEIKMHALKVDGTSQPSTLNPLQSGISSPNLQALNKPSILSTPRRADLLSDNRSISRAPSFRPTQKADQELLDLSPFELKVALDYINIWNLAILALTSALEQKEIVESVRASRQLSQEQNYWVDLGDQICNFIRINHELYSILGRFGQINEMLRYLNLVECNIDYQIQHGGLQHSTYYPMNKQELIEILLTNMVLGLLAAHQHLQLREIYREIRFVKESNDLENTFAKNICSIIENIEADKDMKSHNNETVLNQTFSHRDGPGEAPGSYWQLWREKFQPVQKQ